MHVVFQIEPMFDSLLYTKFVVASLVFLLIDVQLFDDVLLFTPMIATLMLIVATTMIIYLM
jgi:hypothetical protein